MGTAERREREREQTRTLIIEAARDLLSEQGLGGLSIRTIAERVEYSPGTIYLYFKDKDELVHQVVAAGFVRLAAVVDDEVSALGETANALERYGAMGRGYTRFALENPAYFRVMFELPSAAEFHCPAPCEDGEPLVFDEVADTLRVAASEGVAGIGDARRTALIGWGLVHGLTSLYLAGHLSGEVTERADFEAVIDEAMQTFHAGLRARTARTVPVEPDVTGPRVVRLK